jgi:hypothetical protein
MHTAVTLLVFAIALLLVVWPVGLALGVAWVRSRRAEAARLQIALTDALDATVGPIVAPVVRPGLRRPWRIELAVPATRFPLLGRVLAVAHETLSRAEGLRPGQYRIVVSPAETHSPASVPRGWSGSALPGRRAAA